MANNIEFHIGTKFNGEGMKRAIATVGEVNKSILAGSGNISRMATAFGEMDAGASKAMVAVSGMLQAVLSFNVATIATQAVMTGISYYAEHLKEETEKCAARMNELKSAMEQTFASTLAGRVKEIRSEIGTLVSDFERITKEANAFTAALEGVRAANAKGGVVALETEKLQKLLDEQSEGKKAAIEAEYNLKIATEKALIVEEEWGEKIAAAHEARVQNTQRIAALEAELAETEEAAKELEDRALVAKENNFDGWQKIQAEADKLRGEANVLESKLNEARANSEVLQLKEAEVRQNSINAIGEANNAVLALKLKEEETAQALEDRKAQEQLAASAAAEKAAADERLAQIAAEEADLKAEATRIQREVNDNAQALSQAEAAYEQALSAYNARFAQNTIDTALSGTFGSMKSGTIPVRVVNGIQATVVDKTVDDAIRNHLVNTVADADREARDAARDARNMANTNSGQRAIEAKAYQRILNKSDAARSAYEKKFLATYEKIKDAQESQAKELKDRKAALEDLKKKSGESVTALQAIDTKLKSLGLK